MNFGVHRPSIRRRITVVLVAACALVWVAVYLQGLYITRKPESGTYDRDMQMVADSVSNVLQQWPDPAQFETAHLADTITMPMILA